MGITRRQHIGNSEVSYSAEVEEIDVSDGAGKPGARYVYTQYLREDISAEQRATRPVLFVFNGGPGSSSVWTHLGGIGPRRVADADSLSPTMSPPFTLVDNEDSPLDMADLVFIDPPGTGYSRLLDDSRPECFYGVEQDARATLEFIGRWVRLRRRESSPRFIAGESYGTVRAARMSRLMNGGPFRGGHTRSTSLSGAIVLGPGFAIGEPAWSGDVAVAMELPTLAASARFHGSGAEADEEHVWRLANFELLPALVAGNRLPEAERLALAEQMAALIGIDAQVILARDLRVTVADFTTLALADSGRHIGKYDSRFTLPADAAGDDIVTDDPGMGQYMPQFLGSIEAYLRDELEYATDEEYRGIAFFPFATEWDWGEVQQPTSTGIFGEFAEALRRSPRFEVLVCVGDYDLVTTLAATEFALSRHRFDDRRVHVRRYASGHMPYLGAASREQLASDLRAFVDRLSG